LDRPELPFSLVPGEVKNKISIFGPFGQNETGDMVLLSLPIQLYGLS
jgi:hypothetical protein